MVIILQLAIKEAYLNKPVEPLNGEQLLEEPFFTKRMKALKQDEKITHYKVADKGWIKSDSDKIKKKSPLDWTEFGFKALNGGKEYCYSVKDINRGENSTSAFIQEVWNNIDTNKDKIIDVKELDKVKNNRNKLTQLSKLVCKHKSEWSYSPDEIEDEVKEYHKLELDKAVGEQKKKLEEEQNKQIETIKARVENLSFWDKVEHGESEYVYQGIYNWWKEPWFAEEVKKKTERFFDTNQNEVWHFHPIAFVEHMKLIMGNKEYKWAHSEFAKLIGKYESRNNYNLCNKTKGGLSVVSGLTLSDYTLGEVQEKQKNRDLFAVGRYQIIPITLKGAVKSLNLKADMQFDENLQDRIFEEYLINIKRPKIINYLEGNGSLEDAMYSTAKEWASVAVEAGKKISKGRIARGGQSYYTGDGLNKAHISTEEIKKVLVNSKNNN